MSAVAAKPQAGGAMNPTAMGVGVVMLLIILALCWYVSPNIGLMALIGIIIGGVLIGFGTHFVPVGGAPAAMGQAPGIATGVAMLAAGAGLAGLFGGAWAAEQGIVVATITGGVGGGLMMAITCMMVNFVYVFGMGIPSASGKVQKIPSPVTHRLNINLRELKVTDFRLYHSSEASLVVSSEALAVLSFTCNFSPSTRQPSRQ